MLDLLCLTAAFISVVTIVYAIFVTLHYTLNTGE
jgi:hypothetical protein